jgi:polysaccharide export outer membrane protein
MKSSRSVGGLQKGYSIMSRSILIVLLAVVAFGQSSPVESGANLPAQPVGSTDLLSVSVYGAPEFSRTLRVSEDGRIRLPMLRDALAVEGMLPAQMEVLIANALDQSGILVSPQVTVTIADYHSRPVNVVGAVRSPLTFQAMGKTTLLEAITRAQGLSEDAGTEILVTHPGKSGGPPRVERIPVNGLIMTADPVWNVPLAGGEEVRVPPVGKIFVVGNVKKPGAFRADDGTGMSLLKALALAEGLSSFAQKSAYIYRRGPIHGDGSAQAAPKEVVVALQKIMDRKASDISLSPNDILYIPDNRTRRAAMTALERALGFASNTASGALVLGVNR